MPRFNRRGRTGVYAVVSLASETSPSAAAIAAGTALHPALRALTGFTSETEDLDNSDMSSTFGKTIPGGETPAASSMTFAAGDNTADVEEGIRAALPEGQNLFICFTKWSKTPIAGQPVDVWPVRCKAVNDEYSVDNAVAQFMVGMSIPHPPSKNRTMVA